MNPLTQSKNATILPLLIALTLGCFGLSSQARADCRKGCDDRANTFLGDDALISNTTGAANVAIGAEALFDNTTGESNTALGYFALHNNTTARLNVAVGNFALSTNTIGAINTATGSFALWFNTTGSGNTATGDGALAFNTTGDDNTANGLSALEHNSTGSENTATGAGALNGNNAGNDNTACGSNALGSTSGSNNIGLGQGAGFSLTTGDNNIDIGNTGVAGESGIIRIGTEGTHTATYIAGINEAPLVHGAAVAVGITADGQLGVRASSERFKEAIKPMDKASEAILALRPVTFRYKTEFDPKGAPQFGLVAEQVAKVNPDLVMADDQGKPFSVRYEEVNAMLLNEFLKEHRTVQELKSTVAKQEETILQQKKDFQAIASQQQRQIEALTAGLQKVSTQVEASRTAKQVVNNP